MPDGLAGKKYIVVARDYMLGYAEARGLTENSLAQVSKFLKEEVVLR